MNYKAAVLGGENIEKYSLSPKIHNEFFKQTNINGKYIAISVEPNNLFQTLLDLQQQGYIGVNLTIPHKIDVLKYIKNLDFTATIIGAVNTIHFKNDQIIGYNTDWFGFIETLNHNVPKWKKNAKVIIFGAGGATRACIYGLLKSGIKDIYLCNRTDEKAEQLATLFNIKMIKWEDRNKYLSDRNILINTTSAGMNNSQALAVDLKNIQNNSIIYDVIYDPFITPLLQQAKDLKDKNLFTINGYEMLLFQAAKAFEFWFGIYPIEIKPKPDYVF